MKRAPFVGRWITVLLSVVISAWVDPGQARALTNIFFNVNQTTNFVASGTTSDTISSLGYLFNYTRDKLFTGGVGLTNPIGRYVRISWPAGLEAQAVTAGPAPGKAQIRISRQDRQPFDIAAFTARLLANTAGAGGSIEVMPQTNGEDGLADPLMFDATGVAGNQFTYNTPALAGYDAYKFTLYVDFALMSLTTVDASIGDPALVVALLDVNWIELSWPTNAVGYTLQSTTNLPATAWEQVTNTLSINGEVFSVPLETSCPRRYFRLWK